MSSKINRSSLSVFLSMLTVGGLAQTTLYVGAGAGEYSTIASAFSACTSAGTNYIIEIKSSYVNSETKPITFNSYNAASIMLRPHSSVSSTLTLSTSSAVSVFNFTGADNITIDGRVGSSGSSGLLTIENTQATASRYAIQFSGGSTGNTLRYCTIKGSNTSGVTSSTAPGVIMFGSGTNNNNTISNCIITKSGADWPAVLINSYDNSTNNLLTISNNEMSDASVFYIYANGNSNTDWTISNNSFYQNSSLTSSLDHVFIYLTDGGNYTITGNYFGGRAANCGGAAYEITGSRAFYGVYFSSSTSSTTNVVSGNTFQNITYTTTKGSGYHFCFIFAEGTANYTVGSSGNGNLVGSSSGTGNITITDNGNSTSMEYYLGYFGSTGTVSIAYNTIGGITHNGSNTAAAGISLVYVDDGTVSITNNTFGNSTSENIINNNRAAFWGTMVNISNGAIAISNNTFQNIKQTGTRNFNLVNCSAGPLTCNANTFENIYSSSTSSEHHICYFSDNSNFTFNSNTIYHINFTAAAASSFIYCDAGNGTATINSNIIGAYGLSNDIQYGGNGELDIIYVEDGDNVTCNGNVIENIYLSDNGASNLFKAIYFAPSVSGTSTCNNNGIDNISSNIGASTAQQALVGIDNSSNSTLNLDANTITDLVLNNTGAVFNSIIGIAIQGSGRSTASRNKLTGYTNTTSLAASAASINGIYINSGGNSKYLYNNVIMLSNDPNTNALEVHGVYVESSSDMNIYHNTIKISGAPASGALNSSAIDFIATSGHQNISNNLLQNLRSGGTGKHYTIIAGANGNNFTEDYNYLETADPSTLASWASTDKTFASWNTSSGATQNKTGTITVGASGGVSGATTSDVMANGTNVLTDVATDFDGNSRSASPWRGAFEAFTPLPVELISFNAVRKNDRVELSWKIATETENDYYTVERSQDGRNYDKMGRIKSEKNSDQENTYDFTDDAPLDGVSYYRLSQTDLNGEEKILAVTVVNASLVLPTLFRGFPNPCLDKFTCLTSRKWEGHAVCIKIYNDMGNEVKTMAWQKDALALDEVVEIDTREWQPGIYTIKTFCNNTSESIKVVKANQ